MPVPIAMNVPKVPPPWSITFPTLFTNSLPLNPYLKNKDPMLKIYWMYVETNVTYLRAENPPKSAPLAIPTQNPIVNP